MDIDVEELFREHHIVLYRYLMRLSGDPDLAADAVQHAFTTMMERSPKDTNRKAWLFTVATNFVREVRRSHAKRRDLAVGAVDRIAPEGGPPPDESAIAVMESRRVRKALDRLSDRDRTVLLMREEGFTHREIAEAVDTTTGSVGTIAARALDKLADALNLDDRRSS